MIAIIAVLAAMLLPALAGAKERGRRVACLSQARQIALGGTSYADDFDGVLPGTGLDNNGAWGDRVAFWATANQIVAMTGPTVLFRLDYAGNNLKFMLCPSRTDHPFTGVNNNMYVLGRYWNSGFSTYIWDASACFTQNCYGHGWQTGAYWSRIDQLDPRQLLIADVITYEPNVNWREYRSTNHLAGSINQPAGGNYVRADGSGRWLPYAGTNWLWFGNNCECRPGDDATASGYLTSSNFRSSGVFWSAPNGNCPSGPKRGKAFFYDD